MLRKLVLVCVDQSCVKLNAQNIQQMKILYLYICYIRTVQITANVVSTRASCAGRVRVESGSSSCRARVECVSSLGRVFARSSRAGTQSLILTAHVVSRHLGARLGRT